MMRNRRVPTILLLPFFSILMSQLLDHSYSRYLQDQLIVFMALALGESKILSAPLTLHTKTAIHFASSLTGASFQIIPSPIGKNLVEIQCQGIGLNKSRVT